MNKQNGLIFFYHQFIKYMWYEEHTRKSYGNCKQCNYTTINKCDFNRHLCTKKHLGLAVLHDQPKKKGTKCKYYCICGKKYRFQSGLCKHKHKCILQTVPDLDKKLSIYNERITEKLDNITVELFNTVLTHQQHLVDTISKLSEGSIVKYNNCNNKKMTVNVFLNENCKDAMNFTEFVENLKVGIEDLLYTKEHGYVKGISNIFVKHLNDLSPTERPIHCSDRKRLQFYVKEEDKWGKDTDNNKINKSINNITGKQITQFIQWHKDNPTYANNERSLEEYFELTCNVMGGCNKSEVNQNEVNITKNLGHELEIKMAMIQEQNPI
jgi:hypothetical protein